MFLKKKKNTSELRNEIAVNNAERDSAEGTVAMQEGRARDSTKGADTC